MTDRRTFLSSVAAIVGGALDRPSGASPAQAPRVVANPSVFFAPPDGRRNLVRFAAQGVGAPAGRLRLYDARGTLVGTVGMIRRDGELYGELWTPLQDATRFTSELEAPGLRGVLRSTHRLRPGRRWTIHWLTVVDHASLLDAAADLSVVHRAVQRALAADVGATTHPAWGDPRSWSHLGFLERLDHEGRDARALGLPPSDVAVVEPDGAPSTVPMLLRGAGMRAVAVAWRGGPALRWWTSPDGSRVLLLPLTSEADPRALGFGAPAPPDRRVERWLTTSPLLGGADYPVDAALVVDRSIDEETPALRRARQEWNRRFAFPRILSSTGRDIVDALSASARSPIPTLAPRAGPIAPPTATAHRRLIDRDARERGARTDAMMAALTDHLPEPEGASGIAKHVDSGFPGFLVFNASPFRRTDVVALDDGRELVVTDVPPSGYAFVLDPDLRGRPAPRWHDGQPDDALHLEGPHLRVGLDRASGAIASVVTRGTGRDWAAPGGLNAVDGARLLDATRRVLPGHGSRLVATRQLAGGVRWRTVVTIRDAVPWVDVHDEPIGGGRLPPHAFAFAGTPRRVVREVPAGTVESAGSGGRFGHGGWIGLHADAGTAFLGSLDSRFARVDRDGVVVCEQPAGGARFRLWVDGTPAEPTQLWRLGLGLEPMRVEPVPGPGSGRLPRFGSLLTIAPQEVLLVRLGAAADGDGLIAHLLEVAGRPQVVSVAAGLLRFAQARLVDLRERDRGDVPRRLGDGVLVSLPARGTLALRLRGTAIAGT